MLGPVELFGGPGGHRVGRRAVLFDPVVVQNYADCTKGPPKWLVAAQRCLPGNVDLQMVVDDDLSYGNKTAHRYAHFVDGGITDNLGLRAMLETVEVMGGANSYLQTLGMPPPRRIAVIAVNLNLQLAVAELAEDLAVRFVVMVCEQRLQRRSGRHSGCLCRGARVRRASMQTAMQKAQGLRQQERAHQRHGQRPTHAMGGGSLVHVDSCDGRSPTSEAQLNVVFPFAPGYARHCRR